MPVSLAAFGAPVGGLLFAMEEVSSFWKNKLSFQVRKAISILIINTTGTFLFTVDFGKAEVLKKLRFKACVSEPRVQGTKFLI